MKRIPLQNSNLYALVDAKDYQRVLAAGPWYEKRDYSRDGALQNVYAMRSISRNGKHSTQTMHAFVLNVRKGTRILHLNHQGTDNTRSTLKLAKEYAGPPRKRKLKVTSSEFQGVSRKGHGWAAYSTDESGHRVWLGYHEDENDAKQGVDQFIAQTFGKETV